MDRARQAGRTALIAVLVIGCFLAPLGSSFRPTRVLAADVGWPVATLVVSEVQTGGASASDEFVEIANQGAGTVDLAGLEVVYATSSGSTVTRKAAWSASTVLPPGHRVVIANAAGAYAASADLTYSGGFAATGGAVALRVVGGTSVDAVGWGDAVNAFVEGAAAPAPAAGSSLERLPGGAAGNGIDTNVNLADWFVQAVPNPQSMAAPAVPAGPAPTPSPVATPSPTASPTPTPVATPSPTPVASPTPTPVATPSATATPTPTATPIGAARALADGITVTIEGTLTSALGALESGRSGFIQDGSGGIGLYLDATVAEAVPAGSTIRVTGVMGTRYQQRVLRIAQADLGRGIGRPPRPDRPPHGSARR